MILKINDRFRNRKIDFFTNFKLSMRYDSVGSAFQLDYYFDPDNPEHKELSCIGHFHTCTLEHNNELVLTGIILSIEFNDSPQDNLVKISGYSLPGVLGDCEVPIGIPLQSDGLNLREISDKFISPFGIKSVIDSSVRDLMEEPYGETNAKETQSVKSYLSELASQKNIIISHNEKGQLVYTRALSSQKSIFDFERGIPSTSFKLQYNGQPMHSRITAFAQADIDPENQSAEDSVDNPFCPIVFRPHVVVQNSGSSDDTIRAAQNALQKELRNISLTITLDRWILNGKIIRPGSMITVLNPKIYLYNKAKFFIDGVDFVGNAQEEVAVLNCVVPEVYTGETPKYIWRGINTHYNG